MSRHARFDYVTGTYISPDDDFNYIRKRHYARVIARNRKKLLNYRIQNRNFERQQIRGSEASSSSTRENNKRNERNTVVVRSYYPEIFKLSKRASEREAELRSTQSRDPTQGMNSKQFYEFTKKFKDWRWLDESWQEYVKRPYTIYQEYEFNRRNKGRFPEYYMQPYVLDETEPSRMEFTIYYGRSTKNYAMKFSDLLQMYRGKNKEVRGKTVLYYNKAKNSLGIKYIPIEGNSRYIPFDGKPDFWKRNIFYLRIIEDKDNFKLFTIKGYTRENVFNWYLKYNKYELENKYNKETE